MAAMRARCVTGPGGVPPPALASIDGSRRRVCLAGLAALFASACGEPPPAGPAAGERLPQLVFARLDGSPASIAAYSGKALVLNLWATWCGPCRAEMPSLQRLAEMFSAEDLAVIAISVDHDLNLVREFLLRYAIRFPVYADTRQPSVRGALGVLAYPTTWLVRRDGRIAEQIAGEKDWAGAQTVARIVDLLGVQPRARAPG